jgi:hypothetical protein
VNTFFNSLFSDDSVIKFRKSEMIFKFADIPQFFLIRNHKEPDFIRF